MHAPAGRRALLVGVQHPLDPALPRRPGTCAALRRLGRSLQAGGYTVRALLDDAAHDAERPLFANLLDGLRWLTEAPGGLAVISATVQDGRLFPRDGRVEHPERTALALAELGAGPGTLLVLDAAVEAPAGPGPAVAAGVGARPAEGEGPTAFLRAVAGALAPGPAPLTGAGLRDRLAEALPTHPPSWQGEPPREVLGAADVARPCGACGAEVQNPTATFCPACGAPLLESELLDNGRYRLQRRLGAGGMGQVYLALDTRLGVERAIKLLALPARLPPAERAHLRARMIQEARAAQVLSDLTHHVVRVFDVGHAPERDEPYLVMELLEGETLGARLARGRLPLVDALAIGRSVAGALALAHARGFVHRDLKPDNIMLCRRGEAGGFVKLLDFGLVKGEQAEVITESGRMMGTLQYMPPEQLRGQPVDARADVFSLGAVLYECVSGRRANPGRTQQEIFAVLLDRGVAPLATPDVPEALTRLIEACVALDQAQRPTDAGAVARALNAIEAPAGQTSVFAETLASADVLPVPTEAEASSLVHGEVSAAPAPAPRRPLGLALGAAALLGVGLTVALLPTPAAPPPLDAGLRAVARPPDAAPPPPDAAVIPDAAPATAELSVAVDARPDVARALEGTGAQQWIRYTGAPPAVAAAIARDVTLGSGPPVVQDAEVEARWADLPPAVRAWLAEGVSLAGLAAPGGALVPIARFEGARPERRILNGIGVFWVAADRPAVVESARCPRLEVGDRLFTVRWSMPGYTGGQCSGAPCVERLERALHRARGVGERLTATLTVARGEDAGARLDIACRVGP
ncbi:MAG: protein kinase [Myxococcales bacterium]|nr:protein kinase [Myxococcales bacterium]